MERPKCLIKNLDIGDKIGLWVACLFLYIMSISLLTIVLYMGLQSIYNIIQNIDILFTSNPDFKTCVYVSICIIALLVLGTITVISILVAINRTIDCANGDLYKFTFYDNNDNVIQVKYETLQWLNKQGYKLVDAKNIE